jgi:hypothetical protein
MKDEADPITDDEWLLRVVDRTHFIPNLDPVVRTGAFEPRGELCKAPDHDGISLFRKDCLRDPREVLVIVSQNKWDNKAIVQVQVSWIKQQGLQNGLALTVDAKPVPDVKGHVVIPQLDVEALKNKSAMTVALKALAKQASEQKNILVRPVGL